MAGGIPPPFVAIICPAASPTIKESEVAVYTEAPFTGMMPAITLLITAFFQLWTSHRMLFYKTLQVFFCRNPFQAIPLLIPIPTFALSLPREKSTHSRRNIIFPKYISRASGSMSTFLTCIQWQQKFLFFRFHSKAL
jgi:hypothetical protein